MRFVSIFISYFIILIPEIMKYFGFNKYKDIYLISLMISVLLITDSKMRYNNSLFVKINFWIFLVLFIVQLVFIMI